MTSTKTNNAFLPESLGQTIQERYILEVLYNGSANCQSIVLLQTYLLPATGSGIAPVYNANNLPGSGAEIGTAIDACVYALVFQYLCDPTTKKPELLLFLEGIYRPNPGFQKPTNFGATYTFNIQTMDAFTKYFKNNRDNLLALFNLCFQTR